MGLIWGLIVLLFVFWLLGFALHVGGGLIHLLLVVAVILVVFNLLTGRGARVCEPNNQAAATPQRASRCARTLDTLASRSIPAMIARTRPQHPHRHGSRWPSLVAGPLPDPLHATAWRGGRNYPVRTRLTQLLFLQAAARGAR